MIAALFIASRAWLIPAAVCVAIAIALLVWAYGRATADRRVRTICFGLKLVGVLALAACLIEPLWSGQRVRPGANYFALVADNSQGMQIKDAGQTKSRGENLRTRLLDDQASWLAKLDADFQVRRYLFDARVQAAGDFSGLDFSGRASAITGTLRDLKQRFQGQPLAGILLFSDGNATDATGELPDLTGLAPVYPVVIGSDDAIKDLTLTKAAVSQTGFEDAPVTVQADVSVVGYAGTDIVAQLFDITPSVSISGKTNTAARASGSMQTNAPGTGSVARAASSSDRTVAAAEQTQRATRNNETLTFRFEMRPERTGVLFYSIRVAPRAELSQPTEASTEATLANNSRTVMIDRSGGPYRVLYVSGRPNWEFKFLNRAISEDAHVQLVGLIRMAKREPKFEFRGRAGESSNPLYRGFDKKTEETERYDQPVLVRLNTRDEHELRGGFPKMPEELFSYDAIVIDDVEAEFFTHDQMALIQRFVSERGGGLLMLGGVDTFQQGNYARNPVGDMLPVYLDHIPEAKPAANLRLNLTREGWLQPWARLRSSEGDERSRIETMPPFQIMNYVRDVKPGANVIATVADGAGKQFPGLVVQRFGHGRVGALMIGDLWRWGLQQEQFQKDLAKAWRQTVRWLVSDVPQRIELSAEQKSDDPNQAVVLRVRARDASFLPIENGSVQITVGRADTSHPTGETKDAARRGSEDTVRLSAEPSLSEPGVYETTFIPRHPGGYGAGAIVVDGAGAESGRSEAGWAANPAADEFKSLKPNRAFLENLAKRTGGEVVAIDKLADFVESLAKRRAPVTESWSFPLWHSPIVFMFALACFAGEWGLRRWKGMP